MLAKGAPLGNKNAAKGAMWADALRMELAQDKHRIRKLTRALLDKAEAGDVSALKELGDRLDGKANQSISGPNGGPIEAAVEIATRPQLTKEEWLKAHGVEPTKRSTK